MQQQEKDGRETLLLSDYKNAQTHKVQVTKSYFSVAMVREWEEEQQQEGMRTKKLRE